MYPRGKNLKKVVEYLPHSNAQLRQDLFALECANFKTEGFFVEFGAANGVDLSNSHLLEKHFGWSGILAEAGRNWHDALRSNRSCIIDTRCVWAESGMSIAFQESSAPALSGASEHKVLTPLRAGEKVVNTYDVPTVSLLDLLEEHKAPRTIDFLSVDTEGSELAILEAFDFSKYSFRAIAVEHNFSEIRPGLHALLSENGYTRVRESLSRWDDWYVPRKSLMK